MKPYSEVLTGLLFSMHSRRFLASLVASAAAWAGWKYGIPYETQAVIQAPIIAFIIGESAADAAQRRGASSVNVGSAGTVEAGSTTVGAVPDELPPGAMVIKPPSVTVPAATLPPVGTIGTLTDWSVIDSENGEVINHDFAG